MENIGVNLAKALDQSTEKKSTRYTMFDLKGSQLNRLVQKTVPHD